MLSSRHSAALLVALLHQLSQTEILPCRLLVLLGCALDAKGSVLIRHDVILVFGIDGLMLRGHVDFIVGEPIAAEVLEEVGVVRGAQMDVREL